jgi:hypothetical protein
MITKQVFVIKDQEDLLKNPGMLSSISKGGMKIAMTKSGNELFLSFYVS